jgi:hypothetical protein
MIDIANTILEIGNQLSPTVGNALTLGVTFGFFAIGIVKATKDKNPNFFGNMAKKVKKAFEVKELTAEEAKEASEMIKLGEYYSI